MPRTTDPPLTPVALCVPTARIVYVSGFMLRHPDGSETPDHEVFPVVALAAQPRPDPEDGPRLDAVIVDPTFGVLTTDAFEAAAQVSGELVVATWPESEDPARLAAVSARLEANALEAARRRARKSNPAA